VIIEPHDIDQLINKKVIENTKRPTMMDADIKAVSTQKLLQTPIGQIMEKSEEVEESSRTS
jgi:hypothetical protein